MKTGDLEAMSQKWPLEGAPMTDEKLVCLFQVRDIFAGKFM